MAASLSRSSNSSLYPCSIWKTYTLRPPYVSGKPLPRRAFVKVTASHLLPEGSSGVVETLVVLPLSEVQFHVVLLYAHTDEAVSCRIHRTQTLQETVHLLQTSSLLQCSEPIVWPDVTPCSTLYVVCYICWCAETHYHDRVLNLAPQ